MKWWKQWGEAPVSPSIILTCAATVVIIVSLIDYFFPDEGASSFSKGSVHGQGKSVDIWTTAGRANTNEPANKFVVYLVGGPNGRARPNDFSRWGLKDFNQQRKNGVTTIVVGYAGTNERSYFPDADLPEAIDDVVMVLQDIRARNPDAKICLLGESLGGFLALKVIQTTAAKDGVAGYILVNPLVIAPEEQYNAFLEEKDGKRLWYWSINKFIRRSSGDKYIGEVTELRYEIFHNFFGSVDFPRPITNVGDDALFKRVFVSKDRNPSRMANIVLTNQLWSEDELIPTWSRGHSLEEYAVLRVFDRRRISAEIDNCFRAPPQNSPPRPSP